MYIAIKKYIINKRNINMDENKEKELLEEFREYNKEFNVTNLENQNFIFGGHSYSDSGRYIDFEDFQNNFTNKK